MRAEQTWSVCQRTGALRLCIEVTVEGRKLVAANEFSNSCISNMPVQYIQRTLRANIMHQIEKELFNEATTPT